MNLIKKSLFLLLAVAIYNFQCHAQDFNNYRSIRSGGIIPQKFLTSTTQKYKQDIAEKISRKEKRSKKSVKREFFLESNYEVNEMLLSGRVLFNDPVSVYLNKVMDELLKDDPETRSKVEVYTLKSTAVNAFTYNNGVIFVTMGMIAHLKNEAQLAFVLSHEVTHFKKQHALNRAIVYNDINNARGDYKRTKEEDRLLARSVYSKQNESEADLGGYYIYLKTKYDLKTIDGMFDVLQYSHLPFDQVPFDRKVLETDYLKFPNAYFLKKVTEIQADDKDDSLGTHPGVALRREAIISISKLESNMGRKEFIVSEKDFFTTQKICRYELSTLYNSNTKYEAALYNTYLLLKQNPDSKYLKICMAKALYGLSKFSNALNFGDVHYRPEEIQGESQQVYFLFENLTQKEKNALAVCYLWHLKQQYPDDKEIEALTADIFHEMVVINYNDKSYFSATANTLADTTKEKDLTATEEKSKQQKTSYVKNGKHYHIHRSLSATNDSSRTESFAKYAFADIIRNPDFVSAYDMYAKDIPPAVDAPKDKRSVRKALKEQARLERQKEREEWRAEKKGRMALDLNKVLIINPEYFSIDYSYTSPSLVMATESKQKEFNKNVKESATAAGIDFTLIDKKDLDSSSSATFNDIAVLNNYLTETSRYGKMHFVNYMATDVQDVVKKYGTPYFCWTGMTTVGHFNPLKAYKVELVLASLALYPFLPLSLHSLFRTDKETVIYNRIINATNGNLVYEGTKSYRYRGKDDIVRSGLYDLYLQFKRHRNRQ